MSIIEEYEVRLKEEKVVGVYLWISNHDWKEIDELRVYILQQIEEKRVLTRKQEELQYLIFYKTGSIISNAPMKNLTIETFDEKELEEVITWYELENPSLRYKEIRADINGPESFMTRIPYTVIYELYQRKKVPFDRQIFVGCLVRYNVWHGAQYKKELSKEAKDKLLRLFPMDAFSLDILMGVFEMELGVSTAFYLESDINIGGLIIALVEMDVLDRNTVHAKILEAFNNPSLKQTTHGWVRNMHKDLAFTTAELLEYQDNYHNLLYNDRNLLASYGLQVLKKMSTEPTFNWSSLIGNLEGIVYREKFNSGFNIVLGLLQKQLKKDHQLLEQTCINLAPIFLQTEHKVQLKAKAIYEMAAPSEAIKMALTPYVDTMNAAIKKDLSAFLDGIEQEDTDLVIYQQEAYSPLPLDQVEKLVHIKEEEDFIFLTSKVLKSQDALDLELFLVGILKFHTLNVTKKKALSPALKQAERLLAKQYIDITSKVGATHYMIAKLICIWLNPNTSTFEQDVIKWEEAIQQKNLYISRQWLTFFKMLSRFSYVASLISNAKELPLLSTPTHSNGQIHPQILLERLAEYNKANSTPHEGDFKTAMCRLNRWTPIAVKVPKGAQNLEYYTIINYLLDTNQAFDPKQIQNLENCWLTAFAIKNPNKAIDATLAYQDKKDWWQASNLTAWKVGRRYSDGGKYSWPTFDFETGLVQYSGENLKRDCYFGNHMTFEYLRIADIAHWFHRDLFLLESLYLNICQRNFSYLSDLEADSVKEVMGMIKSAINVSQPVGKIGHLFLSLSLFCGDRAIRTGTFDWLCQLVEEKLLNLDWFIFNVKTLLVNPDHPIPLPRVIEQLNELKQLGGEYLYLLQCILIELLEHIDPTNLPKGFSKILNLYNEILQMTDTKISVSISVQLEKMLVVSSVKKEAKKLLNT